MILHKCIMPCPEPDIARDNIRQKQWHINDFQERGGGGAPTPDFRAKTYSLTSFFVKNYLKISITEFQLINMPNISITCFRSVQIINLFPWGVVS